jgi:thiol-disulfide isomerase/thioredoxin
MNRIFSLFVILLLFSFPYLRSEKDLTGPLCKKEILKNNPEWQELVASYNPKSEIIKKIKTINREIHIEIFMGCWCPDCRQHVSAYFKIMEMADNPFISTSYIGIPREKEARKEFIQGKNIVRIPTFIIYFQNQEVGRIIETPTKSVEEDLIDIIERN